VLEGFRFTGIEQSEDYCAIARRRIAHWAAEAAKPAPAPKAGKAGRWPPNVILDRDAAALLDEQSGECKASNRGSAGGKRGSTSCYAQDAYTQEYERTIRPAYGDTGGASRFMKVIDDDPDLFTEPAA
jgi:hypothetical protein